MRAPCSCNRLVLSNCREQRQQSVLTMSVCVCLPVCGWGMTTDKAQSGISVQGKPGEAERRELTSHSCVRVVPLPGAHWGTPETQVERMTSRAREVVQV